MADKMLATAMMRAAIHCALAHRKLARSHERAMSDEIQRLCDNGAVLTLKMGRMRPAKVQIERVSGSSVLVRRLDNSKARWVNWTWLAEVRDAEAEKEPPHA